MTEQPDNPSLDWDGRALRILRRTSAEPGEGLRVVAWAQRSVDGKGQWLRWQSPPLLTRVALNLAWQKAQLWAQTPSDEDRLREVRTVALDQWQIYYYRGNAWSNPLSSSGTPEAPAPASSAALAGATGPSVVPDGVRLVLTLSSGQAISGTLTRDWVRGQIGGGK
jgi:general secretion pathway protein J